MKRRIKIIFIFFTLFKIFTEDVLENYPLMSPIKDIHIEKLKLYQSSDFGYRQDPIGGTGILKLHRGIDIVGHHHAEIIAIEDGIVKEHWLPPNGRYKGHPYYGSMIIIEHENGKYFSLYAHLSKTFICEGEKVKKGQVIGLQGDTGIVTGEHLHFEIIINYHYFLELLMTTEDRKIQKLLYDFMEGESE